TYPRRVRCGRSGEGVPLRRYLIASFSSSGRPGKTMSSSGSRRLVMVSVLVAVLASAMVGAGRASVIARAATGGAEMGAAGRNPVHGLASGHDRSTGANSPIPLQLTREGIEAKERANRGQANTGGKASINSPTTP